MVNGIGHAHKLGKQNSQRPGVTHNILERTSPTYVSHDKSNINVYVSSE